MAPENDDYPPVWQSLPTVGIPDTPQLAYSGGEWSSVEDPVQPDYPLGGGGGGGGGGGAGSRGSIGSRGSTGSRGSRGSIGSRGTVLTLTATAAPGSAAQRPSATVSSVGPNDYLISFIIPIGAQGSRGSRGTAGSKGTQGPMGPTGRTGPGDGIDGSVTLFGPSSNGFINFTKGVIQSFLSPT